jgi:hypothetical protein
VVHPLGGPDALTVAEATALARRLARYRPVGVEAVGCGASPALAGLPALLGHLTHGVGHAEQGGHPGAQAPVGEPGDDVQPGAQRAEPGP